MPKSKSQVEIFCTKKNRAASRDRHHRRQRPLFDGRAHEHARGEGQDAVRRSVRRVRDRHAGREAGGVSGASRTRATAFSPREINLPRQHLRHEAARRRAHHFGQRRRFVAGRSASARISGSRSVFRSHHGSASLRFSATASWRTSVSTSRPARSLRACLPMPASGGVKVHRGGTYVCMEGPQFSTIAEAHMHRQLRFEVIGMTNVTEAKLAREAEICYATIAMITDYDCWHPEHDVRNWLRKSSRRSIRTR